MRRAPSLPEGNFIINDNPLFTVEFLGKLVNPASDHGAWGMAEFLELYAKRNTRGVYKAGIPEFSDLEGGGKGKG